MERVYVELGTPFGRAGSVLRYGHWGRPVIVFPSEYGRAWEAEDKGLISALAPLIGAGRIKLYCCDDLAGRAWVHEEGDIRHRSWKQNAFDRFVADEMVPAIFQDCGGRHSIVAAGASLGAFNALASLCRHPDLFRAALCMSGTFNLEPLLEGSWNDDFYFASPLHFLPSLGGADLERLRRRFVLLAYGGGRFEHPDFSWRMAELLGSKGIPNRVDPWGGEWHHDWSTWQRMLPAYLEQLC